MVKNSPANPGDAREVILIPGSRRSPGVLLKWQPTPVFLPGAEEPDGLKSHGVTKSWTQLSD